MVSSRPTADEQLKRNITKGAVLNVIREVGAISRAELAERLVLSRTTVSYLVDDLLHAGLVRELGTGASRGGRRPIMLQINGAAGHVVGIDIGATHLCIRIFNLAGEPLGPLWSTDLQTDGGWQTGVATVVANVKHQVAAQGLPWNQIAGIGLSMPAPLDYHTGSIAAQPVLRTWQGVPLRQKFSEAFALPVAMDNDGNLGALGEWKHGAGRGFHSLAYVKVGTGIGSGLIFEERLYRGRYGSAGEIGHITIHEDGPFCRCGNRGCLESMAAVPSMLSSLRQALEAGRESSVSLRTLSVEALLTAVAEQDPLACEIVRQAGVHLGIALANLANLLAPERIVIGGAITAGTPLIAAAAATLHERVLPMLGERVTVCPAELGDASIATGAGRLILDFLFAGADPVVLRTIDPPS